MRTLLVFLLIVGTVLLVVGAAAPQLFVLSLLGLLLLAGTASVALAGLGPPRPPQPHH